LKPIEAITEQHADLTRDQRGRLFRRYFMLILALVCGALLISGGIGLYFSYQENKVALASLQHEKALSAAARIEQFVLQIEQQLAYAALPQLGVEGLEQRRIEFLKLLRVVHAVTDITQIDAKGREQLSVSRLKMDEAGTDRDWSQEPAFKNARPGQTWYGPVYFRKETEPYMSIAVRSGGEAGAVTVAEVNLKFIWDVVTRIKVGQKGKAYVVDSTGHLVADPDIGLVLRKTDMAGLEQVRTALKPDGDDKLARLAKDLAGITVLTAYAPIEPARDQPLQGARPTALGWKVFVEQPVSEVYQALDATVIRTVALLVAGLLFSALAAMWLARNMARPISVLQEGAQRIGSGDLETQIQMKTGDELESLADQFNRMTAQLRESYAGLERKVEERTAELKQALAFQGASGEILSSITSSIADTQPVFLVIVQNLLRLFGTRFALVLLLRDGKLHCAAFQGQPGFEKVAQAFPAPVEGSFAGKAILAQRVLQIAPIIGNPEAGERSQNLARTLGYNAIVAAPMVREDKVIGAIVTGHQEATPFNDKQIALLRAFADQAVIAIENARLVNETKESLEQQTAISEILRVISGSPSDVQPVLDAVMERAARICEAPFADIVLADGAVLHFAASTGDVGRPDASDRTVPLDRTTVAGRSIVDREPVHVADLQSASEAEFPRGRAMAQQFGQRTILAVPLLRENKALGTIVLRRRDIRPFEDKHIALLKTFADQAAIAIENVRLFNQTKESLEQQTAISEVLRVISGTPSDVKPVLDAVAERAIRLCDAKAATIYVLEGNVLRRTAFQGPPELLGSEALPFTPETLTGRTIAEGKAIHVPDIEQEQGVYPRSWQAAQKLGGHSMLSVPLRREGRPFGTMFLRRTEVRPFSDKQIALANTFADQAAIAIENVRLFNETTEALEQQKASGEVLGAISSSIADTTPVFDKVLESCERLFNAGQLVILLLGDDGQLRVGAVRGRESEQTRKAFPVPLAGTATEIAIRERRALTYANVLEGSDVPDGLRRVAQRVGRNYAVAIAPMIWESRGIGVILLGREKLEAFSDKEMGLLRTFADQAVIAIQNARLFREIQEKSAQLEIANKHKSDFLANMSHELRTPLNAIIGFSEVLMEKMFGEVNEKQADYLKDIHESGRHLLSLINDILDLSKIEAGRMDLEISSFHLPTALSNAMTLVRERAQRHGIRLGLDVDPRLGELLADERKVKQILVNLLSNAVKFTPDGGHVDVIAKQDTTKVAIAVKDTGIGIAPEDQAAVFEEFKQVGRDYTRKAEGTGLGLALTKRFVELHGGEITLASQPGKGSTFTVTLPIRQ
jgi:signal transduction histidine kinase/putative component of toxin-antitoxin plasmid stabilization module